MAVGRRDGEPGFPLPRGRSCGDAGLRGHRTGRRGRCPASRSAPAIIRTEERVGRRSPARPPAPCREAAGGRRGSATAGLAPCWMPSPSQTGHQPRGLLNEKWCGESSSKLRPQPSHEPMLAVSDRPASSARSPRRPRGRSGPHALPRSSADSIESAKRDRVDRRTTSAGR